MVTNNIKLTWKKDKYDKRDYLHTVSAVSTPVTFSLSQFCPPVRDQGVNGSCVGFGIGGILTGLAKQKSIYKQWFSPSWIYNGARFIDGTLSVDVGTEPGDGLAWIKSKGCLLEEYWPYNPNALDKTSPPSQYMPIAAKFPVLTYVRVTGGSAGICSALAAGNLVTIGTPWFQSWMNPTTTGKLSNATASSQIAGGHATFLYGYDKTTKYFSGQNSWGSSWGKAGTFLMPFSVFDSVFSRLGGYDAYYITVNWSSVSPSPSPSPTPTPSPSTSKTSILIRLEESKDNGITWTQLYKGIAPSPSVPATSTLVKVVASKNDGTDWSQLFQGSL